MVPMSFSASAGGGGPSGSSSNAGVSIPVSTPFNFDSSGWVINMGGSNTTTASGNKDANSTTQTPSAQGGSSGLLGGLNQSTIFLLVAAYLLLK